MVDVNPTHVVVLDAPLDCVSVRLTVTVIAEDMAMVERCVCVKAAMRGMSPVLRRKSEGKSA